jgi:hypothetical protein
MRARGSRSRRPTAVSGCEAPQRTWCRPRSAWRPRPSR